MEHFGRGDMFFDVLDAGAADAPVVVLLHGHPQTNLAWGEVIPRLTSSGYRCLAPNQRGVSPSARPTRRRDYRMSELVEDVGALVEASGADRVHLVGHDYGGLVAWSFAAKYPGLVWTLSSLSSPHPAALQDAMLTSRQGLASWYAYFYQLPLIPEWYYLGAARSGKRLAKMLRSGGQQPGLADRDAEAMTKPGAYTAALNWYRAAPWAGRVGKVAVPALMIWSDGDSYILERAARRSERYVTHDFRFEVVRGSHWIPDEQPDAVAKTLMDWFAQWA
ncbi:alpha/beta hydrolase [Mycobacterium lehmannii]|uniref:Alpha/beta hydrolase n=2 Tax=Mycobacterium lehmannii TaxID=2048550 RepID=A0A101A4P2_9MYCO|nr:alpha/beta fold hydrolase [Mycobacterium lehmannii]KUI13601.1 alpha/beta hydrolase [Mycobacterium lehmannii]